MSMRERRNFGKIQFSRTEKKTSPTPYALILFVYVQTTTETVFNVPEKKKANNMNAKEDER